MKKLIFIAIIILSSLTIFAQKTANDYVVTKDCTTFYENLKYGIFSFITGKMDGIKTKYNRRDILEYRKNGVTYTKLPKIRNNTPTKNYTFMKAIAYKNGFVLYEYKSYNSVGQECKSYYIFKYKTFIVDVNKSNVKTLVAFFEKEKAYNNKET